MVGKGERRSSGQPWLCEPMLHTLALVQSILAAPLALQYSGTCTKGACGLDGDAHTSVHTHIHTHTRMILYTCTHNVHTHP